VFDRTAKNMILIKYVIFINMTLYISENSKINPLKTAAKKGERWRGVKKE
jgi:hypothetical protein